jgi:Aspartyl protease
MILGPLDTGWVWMPAILLAARPGSTARRRTVSGCAGAGCLAALLWSVAASSGAAPQAEGAAAPATGRTPSAADAANGNLSAEPMPKVTVQAPEPRYVAPTLRDRIGRIWAPVYLDGKGPFRLVLDTGATESAVTAAVAKALGLTLDSTSTVKLNGVMGTAIVPTIRVKTLRMGDLQRDDVLLPIVPDALGGADGVLGTEGLLDKRIFIDFRRDVITIHRSHERRAPLGYVTVRLEIEQRHLLTSNARVGAIPVTAIIDTGSQTSIANLALREALLRRRSDYHFSKDKIVDATDAVAQGEGTALPPIYIGDIEISGSHITTGDMRIFRLWHLTDKPAILIGMDALGVVDVLVIDYRMRELQIRTRDSGFGPPIYQQ